MDIDSPPADTFDTPSHTHITLPGFSSSFPLPFRVLTLVGFAILLWAINLHVLAALGLDTSRALAITRDGTDDEIAEEGFMSPGSLDQENEHEHEQHELSSLHRRTPSSFSSTVSPTSVMFSRRLSPHALYKPVYALFAVYTVWIGAGWLVWRTLTDGEVDKMEKWRGLIALIVAGVGFWIWMPTRGVGARERRALIASFRRIFVPPPSIPPFFCDVILSDILTSFAKVLGDMWVSAWQIWGGGVSRGRMRMEGWSGWVVMAMVSLPYILRFRQCLHEYLLPSNTSARPLANALKYASAFPVIFLSAAQRRVVSDIAKAKGVSVEEIGEGGRWFGEHRLFRMWLLAVIINSMYSFWWDVTNDWGLSLLQPSTWFKSPSNSMTSDRFGTRLVANVKRWLGLSVETTPPHQRSPCPTPQPFSPALYAVSSGGQNAHARGASMSSSGGQHPSSPDNQACSFTGFSFMNPLLFGLRPTLLFPDPLVYHLFVFVDLVLRFTWSLKLSSHLHTISEIESGVFLMEALELGRRWMWVFLRVEWELVKQMDEAKAKEERERSRTGQIADGVPGRFLDGPSEGDVKIPLVR